VVSGQGGQRLINTRVGGDHCVKQVVASKPR
jgi:hypothetical protein